MMRSGGDRPVVGIAGCGAVTRLYYLPALERLQTQGVLSVGAAFDPDTQAARDFCATFPGASPAQSFDSLIAARPDLLIVASPPSFHAEQAIAALRAGIAVHCEKPLAQSLADGELMVAEARQAKQLLSVGMIRRHLPATQLICRLIGDGVIGAPLSVEIFEGGPFDWPVRSPVYFDRRRGGAGVLEDIGTHCLDLLRWWFGEPDFVDYQDDAMGGIEANCRISLHFGDCRATVRLSRDWHRPNRYVLRGSAGWIRWVVNDADTLEYGADGIETGARLSIHEVRLAHGEPVLAQPAGDFATAFATQIADVVHAMQGGDGHGSAAEALGTLRLIERCHAERRPIAMPWMTVPGPGQRDRPKARIAILGAAGFIGNRAVEMLHSEGTYDVAPIVRRASALALPSRFDITPRLADAQDGPALESAFAGCEGVVATIAGDPATIVDTVAPIYRAAERAGVRRLVYLSTASVHGQSPAPGTDERTPLSTRQPLVYNNAKVRAERRLLELRRDGSVEVVILRPGIVYGPRSQWTGALADQLLAGKAYLVDSGAGICNAIYVDNVVHAIERAMRAEGVDGEAFLIADAETVTWRELVAPIAVALGIDVNALPRPSSTTILAERESVLRNLLFPPMRYMFRRLPPRLTHPLRAARRAAGEHREGRSELARPGYSREMALLHSCEVRLPCGKAESLLGYRPPVGFEEGFRRSVSWLAFAGYPVRP